MALKQVRMTSFRAQDTLGGEPVSVAVYQPRGLEFPKVEWTDIRNEAGKWTRPREFLDEDDPAEAYWAAILELYDTRLEEARAWAENASEFVAMMCWCPYDKAAQRQLQEFGSFICHTGPLGEWIVDNLKVSVGYDTDRNRMYGIYEGD